MRRFLLVQFASALVVLASCHSAPEVRPTVPRPAPARDQAPRAATNRAPGDDSGSVKSAHRQVAFQEPLPAAWEWLPSDEFGDQSGELSLDRLISAVQDRNPSLQAMFHAWRAAAERYPQVVTLDDPMFMTMMAPASFGSSQVDAAYVLEGAQKIPWFGKRDARGRFALAEAAALRWDARQSRLLLAQTARMAFLDYYLVRRRLELNAENRELMAEFREAARARYETGQVTQRDVLQADLELAELERQRIELDRADQVAVARINTLLRRAPIAPLADPPKQLPITTLNLDRELLEELAIQRRPDLAAQRARLRAEQAALTLACKGYYPDAEFFARYDSFWQPASTQSDLRGQIGIRVNVPTYRRRLHASVREAMARVRQRRAEYEQKVWDLRYDVQAAFAQVEESRRSLAWTSQKLLPIAEQNVASARANYDVAKGEFLDLALAQRQFIDARTKQQEALVALHRNLATLDQLLGGAVTSTLADEDQPPKSDQP